MSEKSTTYGKRRISVAPMMDWTDRHCRVFHRHISRHTWLYTEMVTTGALLHGDVPRHLDFDAIEHPVALQLGGSEPADLAQAARLGQQWGYDEINLNCGCPSDRVQDGRFGACLMREPALVAECVAAMAAAVRIPVTVKCRIGVDEQEPRDALFAMVEGVAAAGAAGVIVHARKAWLEGLSPRDNRTVPPLDYPLVYELKAAHARLPIAINGGIVDLSAARAHLAHVDGVMVGRAAYQNPELLLRVDAEIFGDEAPFADPFAALEAYYPYVERQLAKGARLHDMTRHLTGMFAGRPGARIYRQRLSVNATRAGAGLEALVDAVAAVRREEADAA